MESDLSTQIKYKVQYHVQRMINNDMHRTIPVCSLLLHCYHIDITISLFHFYALTRAVISYSNTIYTVYSVELLNIQCNNINNFK